MSDSKTVRIVAWAGGLKTFETKNGEGVSRGGKAEIDGEVVNIEVATGGDDRGWLEGLAAPITLSGLLKDKGKYGFGLWASKKYNKDAKSEAPLSQPVDTAGAAVAPTNKESADKQASIEAQAALDRANQLVIATLGTYPLEDFDEVMLRVMRVSLQFKQVLSGKKTLTPHETTKPTPQEEQAKKDDFPF